MKLLKKLMVVFVAVMMVMSLASKVYAEENDNNSNEDSTTTYTLTIKSTATKDNTAENKTLYSWYKFFEADIANLAEVKPGTATEYDGSLKDSTGKVAYYVENEELATALDALKIGEGESAADLFTITRVGTTNHWNVQLAKTDATADEIANALLTIVDKAIRSGTKEANGITDTKIEGLTAGYYLVTASNGTKLVVQTLGNVTIYEKNYYPTNTKAEDKQNAEIGEVVTYTVDVVIPANAANKPIDVFDTATSGLTMNTSTNSITVKQGNNTLSPLSWVKVKDIAATEATETQSATKAAVQYKATIPAEVVITNAGKTLTLTYTATVNENAIVDEPESNKAHIEFDNYKTVDVEVEVKTFGFDLEKVDKDDHSKKLEGVTFTLTRTATATDGATTVYYYTPGTDDTNINEARFATAEQTVATDKDGKISFKGLHAGTYTLTEIENPNSGYNLLSSPITVTVAADGSVTCGDGATIESKLMTVENAKGAQLPSTGGIGTTIFHIAGAALVLGAGILLISKKRMNNN